MITWVGNFDGCASFPTVNRGLVSALERLGVPVLRNRHNHGVALTERCFAFEYPPQPVNLRHKFSSCLSIWEFGGGKRAVPASFVRTFREFDQVIVPNQFVYEQYREATTTPVRVVRYLGVDTAHYTLEGPKADWSALFPGETWMHSARKIILMVGGTDLRHGWDVALAILKRLPEDVHLVAKWDKHYPVIQFHDVHDRLHILHANLDDMAPLYRTADMFLMTARGVGFSLPVIEAIACGLPVASTPLPPIRDFATGQVIFGEGGSYKPLGIHHVHGDCLPDWWEPDVDSMHAATVQALTMPKALPPAWWTVCWDWDGIAAEFKLELDLV
jgi:glycosyltransferase involved in cell wall biosynthesis